MELKEKERNRTNESKLVLFGFELNQSQTILILIFSLIGLFTTIFELTGYISRYLIYFILVYLPIYLSEPENYFEDFLIYHLSRITINIVIPIIYLLLSIYTLRKILRKNNTNYKKKRKIISQDRIVNWLGLKLSHGQAIFIFCFSLVGILLVIQFYVKYIFLFPYNFIYYLCSIPTGPHSSIENESFADRSAIIMCVIFLVLCLYSLIACRRGKHNSHSKRFVKNYGLVIYIISLIIFSFNLISLSNHLFLYTDSTIYNKYQTKDFHRVISIAIICFILIISAYFPKENPNKVIFKKKELSFLGIKLTENRAIGLLSIALIGITYLSYISLDYFFSLGIFFDDFQLFYSIIITPVIIIILSYYAINTVVKKHRLKHFIIAIENLEEISCKWFKFDLNRLYSVIFYSLSCGFILFNVCYLIMIAIGLRVWTSMGINHIQDHWVYMLEVIGLIIQTLIITLLLIINIYTINRTKMSIKSDLQT